MKDSAKYPGTYQYAPPFTPMTKVFKEDMRDGKWCIERFTMKRDQVQSAVLFAYMNGQAREVYDLGPGHYVRLRRDKAFDPTMSDTPMERRTNLHFIGEAHGRVLVGGLGLGMVIFPLLAKPEVVTVAVLEREPAIIRMVEPVIRKALGVRKSRRLSIGQADVETWEPDGSRFSTVYMDIWNDVCEDHWEQVKRLKRKYRRVLEKGDAPWLGCWREKDMKPGR
jgi:hypothetical protein